MTKEYTKNRQRLIDLAKVNGNFIAISDAAKILTVDRIKARNILWSMTKRGWLKSVKSGLYVTVPLEANNPSLSQESPLVLATHLFSKCYIGGWSAANFWGLTDQLFLNIWIMTTKVLRSREYKTNDHQFILKHIDQDYLYGTKTEWIDNNKILFSDPHKTVIDFLNSAGSFSVSSIVEIFKAYIASEHKNLDLLQEYASRANNKAIFKRLGFLIEKFLPSEKILIDYCANNISEGYSSLSNISVCDRIIRRWNIKVPMVLLEK